MSYQLIFTDSYLKHARRFAKQHPELKEQYRKPYCYWLKILAILPCDYIL